MDIINIDPNETGQVADLAKCQDSSGKDKFSLTVDIVAPKSFLPS